MTQQNAFNVNYILNWKELFQHDLAEVILAWPTPLHITQWEGIVLDLGGGATFRLHYPNSYILPLLVPVVTVQVGRRTQSS